MMASDFMSAFRRENNFCVIIFASDSLSTSIERDPRTSLQGAAPPRVERVKEWKPTE